MLKFYYYLVITGIKNLNNRKLVTSKITTHRLFQLYVAYRLECYTKIKMYYNFKKHNNLNLVSFFIKKRQKTSIHFKQLRAASIFSVINDTQDYYDDWEWSENNYSRVELSQKNRKKYQLQLYNELNETISFWSKKILKNEFMFSIFQVLFIGTYLTTHKLNLFLQYTANNKLYLHNFNKTLTPYICNLYLLNLKFNLQVIISKPNIFFMNFQKKKFGAIKKSRKKLLYLFLPIQQPKLR